MRQPPKMKSVVWVGSSRKDLRAFPVTVQKEVGDALQQVQQGFKPLSAKPLSGFHGAGVLEIRENYDGSTYRAVYTVRFAERVYVLHAFQKKSRHGIETAQHDIELVKARLKTAEEFYETQQASSQEEN